MKRIKILLIICVVLLFSGCSVNYEIDVDRNDPLFCNEQLTINGFDSEIVESSFESFINQIYANVAGAYNIDQSDRDNVIIKKSTCSMYDLSNSKILEKYIISSDIRSGHIEIELDGEELGNLIRVNNGETIEDTGLSIIVNIRVPYKVTKVNTKNVDGNVYTWKFDKDNEVSNIIIEYDPNVKDFRLKSAQLTALALGVLFAIVIVAVLAIYIRHKVVNR